MLKWLGAAAGIAGAVLLAANVPASGWGFTLFLVSSLSWAITAWWDREGALLVLQLAFTATNILGVYRWLVV
jgi:nicotinamide riboside transporter PnuC